MDILEKIVEYKRKEIDIRRSMVPFNVLETYPLFRKETGSLFNSLLKNGSTGIIAEFKRMSPSKGIINRTSDIMDVCAGYLKHGAAAVSVLTDNKFFRGDLDDLARVAGQLKGPFLQKDFIISEYQVVEAKASGADAILLIGSVLDKKEVKSLLNCATNLGMECLIEVHSEDEIKRLSDIEGIIGVNNRNLGTFKTDIQNSVSLADLLTDRKVKVSESGIENAADILYLKQYGYNGFLIGEQFMKADNPVISFREFIAEVKELNKAGDED